MTAKEYLKQVYDIDRLISNKRMQIEVLCSRAQRATTTINAIRTSGTPVHSSMEDAIVKMISLQEEIASAETRFMSLRKGIAQTIYAVENPIFRDLLEYRYLCFFSWERIAVEMHYNYRWVLRLHSRALQAIESHIPSMV